MDGSLSPPPFLTKTFDIVDDCRTDSIVSWSPSSSNSFVVWDFYEFSRSVLPQFFKHSNFASFVRQLNNYGFRKADPDRWEFLHEDFRKGERHRLKNIHRKRPAVSSKCTTMLPTVYPFAHVGVSLSQAWKGVGMYQAVPVGEESEVKQLIKCESNEITLELDRLRSKHQAVHQQIKYMSDHLRLLEMSQQQIFAFIDHSLCTPSLRYRHMRKAIAADRICTQLNPLGKAWEATDTNSSQARKRPRTLNADVHLCGVESGVSVNYNERQLQLQPQSGNVLAASCETTQDPGTWMTTGTSDNETSTSYELKPGGNHTRTCTHSKVEEENHTNATSVYKTADWNQVVEGCASLELSSIIEDAEMKVDTCMKQPVIKLNDPVSAMEKDLLSLYSQPSTLLDNSSSAGTCIGNRKTQVPQETSNNCCEDLESELFWEKLLSSITFCGEFSKNSSECAPVESVGPRNEQQANFYPDQ